MTDLIDEIVEDCRIYWHEVDVPKSTARDMSAELESHLREAAAEGRDPHDVIGGDLASFAAGWANEITSGSHRPVASWESVQSRLEARPATNLFKWVAVAAFLAAIATAVITSGKESIVDNEVWRWVWTILALVMSGAEIITAGFFLLPFGIGAGLAAVAAWIGMNGAVQWVLFFGGTAVSMLYLRRYMRLQDTGDTLLIGPARYVGMTATVLESIDMSANTGKVRVEAEEWRAITDGDQIAQGVTVDVLELRGTRLVVAPASGDTVE